MRPWILAFALPLCITGTTAPPASAAHANSVAPCLVGRWTLTSSSGVAQNAFVGLKMTITNGGVASLDYTHARPFDDGGSTAIFRGHSTIRIATSSGKPPAISVKSEQVNLTERTAFGSGPYRGNDPVWEYSEDYTCSPHTLKMRSGGTGGGLLNGRMVFSR